ncbi:hypothetical protein Pla175_15860 [Pirellulimonas nuda]|uniref:Uncharacterized protein n=1 Tax=Pirellulimonas nuda TaxID=2528009 RepID=A0A518D9R0_9BACT|nr:hypothetical protein [Pirellulimonas nuda]QDU88214.1 hypothetical protein Pla175_15860 [Pirellulimonas nuda]
MLRFNKPGPGRPPNYQSRSTHARMLVAVAVVGGAMLLASRLTTEPATPPAAQEPAAPIDLRPLPQVDRDRLAAVSDNAPFRDTEEASWFYLLGIADQSDPRSLAAGIEEPTTYAQLVSQPAYYRGKGVRVAGSARRIEEVTPAENSAGIERLYRVTLWPSGGQVWPVLMYCLDLPPGIGPGDRLAIPIEAAGYFYKNHSYAWEGGVGLAPVLLAKSFVAPVEAPQEQSVANPTEGLGLVVGAAALIAACAAAVVWLTSRQAKRPTPSATGAAILAGLEDPAGSRP